jgi:hypothetical protein
MLILQCYPYGYESDPDRVIPKGANPWDTITIIVEGYKKDEKFIKDHHVRLEMDRSDDGSYGFWAKPNGYPAQHCGDMLYVTARYTSIKKALSEVVKEYKEIWPRHGLDEHGNWDNVEY